LKSPITNTDGQIVAVPTDLAIAYIQVARKQGFTGPLLLTASQLSDAQIKSSLSGANQNLYSAGAFNNASPGWKQMLTSAPTG
jgi:hypothetical protein